MLRIGVGTERSQLCRRIRCTHHCEGSSFVLSIEGSELGRIIRGEATAGRVVRIVEPEPEVKGVGRWKRYVRIKTEDLVEQNRFDTNVTVIVPLAYLDVRLIPSKTEASLEDVLEVGIRRFVRQEGAALYCEEIEGETGLEPIKIENQSVIQLAADHRRPGLGLLVRIIAKTRDETRICYEVKADLIFLVLSRGGGWQEPASIVAVNAKRIELSFKRFRYCV